MVLKKLRLAFTAGINWSAILPPTFRQNPERVAGFARRAIFKPFGDKSGDVFYEHDEIAPSVVRINARINARSSDGLASVVLAIQPITQDRTGLHVLAGGDNAAERLHYADWARRLRWFMETPDAAIASWRPLMGDQP